MSIASILVTLDCVRSCKHCCNKYGRIMAGAVAVRSLSDIPPHDIVCITGGEPLLVPDRVAKTVRWAREHQPNGKVFLYTTVYRLVLEEFAKSLDGVHFSMHNPVSNPDTFMLRQVQALAASMPDKSWRLYVDADVDATLPIRPNVWKRLQIKPWSTEDELLAQQPNGLPAGETMYIVKEW